MRVRKCTDTTSIRRVVWMSALDNAHRRACHVRARARTHARRRTRPVRYLKWREFYLIATITDHIPLLIGPALVQLMRYGTVRKIRRYHWQRLIGVKSQVDWRQGAVCLSAKQCHNDCSRILPMKKVIMNVVIINCCLKSETWMKSNATVYYMYLRDLLANTDAVVTVGT